MTPAPCPYCRPGEPMLCSAPLPTKEARTSYWVGCQKCLARGPQALHQERAIARWNEVADAHAYRDQWSKPLPKGFTIKTERCGPGCKNVMCNRVAVHDGYCFGCWLEVTKREFEQDAKDRHEAAMRRLKAMKGGAR